MFADLADGGRQLAALLAPALAPDAVLVCIGAGGLVTGATVADELGVVVTPLATARTDDGVEVDISVDVAGREVVVIDDGVETGTAARAVARALTQAGASRVALAVPVCPREAEAELRHLFDEVIAVTKPLERRSLHWYYETFA